MPPLASIHEQGFGNLGDRLFSHPLSRSTGTAVLSSWINSNEKARQSPPREGTFEQPRWGIGAFARVSHFSIYSLLQEEIDVFTIDGWYPEVHADVDPWSLSCFTLWVVVGRCPSRGEQISGSLLPSAHFLKTSTMEIQWQHKASNDWNFTIGGFNSLPNLFRRTMTH